MNRGSGSQHASGGRGRDASMRPRFMNRGSRIEIDQVYARGVASMRPRFMNRGSQGREVFAPAHPRRASMRPRFMNRGSEHLREDRIVIVSGLQ